jgi:hypothetical protein
MDEALAEQQREAYKMAGVDDDEPAIDPSKKRKAVEDEKVSLLIDFKTRSLLIHSRRRMQRSRRTRKRSASTPRSTSLVSQRTSTRKNFTRCSPVSVSLLKASTTTNLVSRCTKTRTANSTETRSSVRFATTNHNAYLLTLNHSLLAPRIGEAGHQYG